MNPTWQQIVELAEKATGRPWTAEHDYAGLIHIAGASRQIATAAKHVKGGGPLTDESQGTHDARYLTAAANAAPDMAQRLMSIAEILGERLRRVAESPLHSTNHVAIFPSEARELLKLLEGIE